MIGLGLGRAFWSRFDEFRSMASSNAVVFRGPLRRSTVSSSVTGSVESFASSAEVGPWRRGCLVIGLGLGRAFWSRFDATTGSAVDFLEVEWFLEMIIGASPSEFRSMASSNATFLVVFLESLRRLTLSSSVVGSVEYSSLLWTSFVCLPFFLTMGGSDSGPSEG